MKRDLRRKLTEAERFFWQSVRAGQVSSYEFVKDISSRSYGTRFVCQECMVIAEVVDDGGDAEKLQSTEEGGFLVMRFGNDAVLEDIGSVLDALAEMLPQREKQLASGKNGRAL